MSIANQQNQFNNFLVQSEHVSSQNSNIESYPNKDIIVNNYRDKVKLNNCVFFTYEDNLNNERFILIKSNRSEFNLIFKLPVYYGEIKRRRSTKTKYNILDFNNEEYNLVSMHNINTRSHKKYNTYIKLEFFTFEWESFQNICSTVEYLFPDISLYCKRLVENTNNVNIFMPSIIDYQNNIEGIVLEGSIVMITKMLISGQIYNVMNEIFDMIDTENTEEEPQEIHLTPEEYKKNIVSKRVTKKYLDTTCLICQENIEKNQTMSLTKCGHAFHSKCLRNWLTKKCISPTCPTCRVNLKE